MKLSPALTWDQLAELYGRGARTKPMEFVFKWASRQTTRFKVDEKEETIHLILEQDNEHASLIGD